MPRLFSFSVARQAIPGGVAGWVSRREAKTTATKRPHWPAKPPRWQKTSCPAQLALTEVPRAICRQITTIGSKPTTTMASAAVEASASRSSAASV